MSRHGETQTETDRPSSRGGSTRGGPPKNAYCAKVPKMAHPTAKLAMLVIQLSVTIVKALTNP